MPDPWEIQRWAFQSTTGNATGKAVLMALAVMADMTTGRCEAKQETLALWVETTDRTIRHWLKELEGKGLIARRHQYSYHGKRRGDEFLLLAPGVVEWPDGMPVELPEGSSGDVKRQSSTGSSEQDYRKNDAPTTGSQLPDKNNHLRNDHSEQPPEGKKRADGRVLIPKEINQHAHVVLGLLKEFASMNGLEDPSKEQLARVLRIRQHKPLVMACHQYLTWLEGVPPSRKHKNLVTGFMWQLDNRHVDLADVERLHADGTPATGAPPQLRLAHSSSRPISATMLKEQRLAEQGEKVQRLLESGALNGLFGKTAS